MFVLYETRFLERDEGSALLHSLEPLGRDTDGDLLAELGDEERLLLEVNLATALAGRIELGRTRAVRIPTADLGLRSCDIAYTCHSRGTLARLQQKVKMLLCFHVTRHDLRNPRRYLLGDHPRGHARRRGR